MPANTKYPALHGKKPRFTGPIDWAMMKKWERGVAGVASADVRGVAV